MLTDTIMINEDNEALLLPMWMLFGRVFIAIINISFYLFDLYYKSAF